LGYGNGKTATAAECWKPGISGPTATVHHAMIQPPAQPSAVTVDLSGHGNHEVVLRRSIKLMLGTAEPAKYTDQMMSQYILL